jgi:hypothetical protein
MVLYLVPGHVIAASRSAAIWGEVKRQEGQSMNWKEFSDAGVLGS